MPLTLSLREGDDFYIGRERLVVAEVFLSEQQVRVRRMSDGKEFDLVDDQAVEVVKDAYLSVGDRHHQGMVRVAIDAPRNVTILRGKLVRPR